VQRWNEASERRTGRGCWPDARAACDLPFPRALAGAAGDAPVQISRTVRAGRYTTAVAAPGAAPFPIAGGETSVLAQYEAAIEAARRTIYVENQFFHAPPMLAALDRACRRGAEVVFVLPGEPMIEIRRARDDPRFAAVLAQLAALGAHPTFTLAGLARRGPSGWRDIYVHAKLMLVDDAWATIGSANLATRSFHGDTELNASVWHAPTVRALRVALCREHLGVDTAPLDDVAALRRFALQARENRERRRRDEEPVGLAVAIEPAEYAR
jgi:phosphatidylserine/phosphatidylglycerophosphate/cardiolipin synthase-like enzyme